MDNYIKTAYEKWLASPVVDEGYKAELRAIADDENEIKSRFVSYLSFGTAGLRGTMAAGTNRMNVYTVAHATQGLADLILDCGAADRGVAIAYDSRINSRLFAETSAAVLVANGIRVFLFDSLRPTPTLSFALRYHKCIAGINITASHNPSEYNGYKAYWEDGAQLPPDHAAAVAASMAKVDIFDDVKRMDFSEAANSPLLTVIGKETDEAYLACVLEQAVNLDAIEKVADSLKIVYTPLYGAGYKLVPEVISRIGLKHLTPVTEEMTPDGRFPGIKNPNPEFKEAFTRGLALAKEVGSDLIIATDPDCDRVGVMIKAANGEFINISGNQMGALLLDYIITAYNERGAMPSEPYAVKTIVSTEMVSKICAENGITLHNVLTGFKFIGEVIKKSEESGHGSFLLGFEESYGYLKGTYARDKDAVVATMLICEMTAFYAARGMTLADALDGLYARYGFYRESTDSITMSGLDGLEKIAGIMQKMRTEYPTSVSGKAVTHVRDYQAGTITELATGKVEPTGLPSSNVMYFELEGGDVIVARPSGTEPKIKIYYLVGDETREAADAKIASYKTEISEFCGL